MIGIYTARKNNYWEVNLGIDIDIDKLQIGNILNI